MNTYIVRCLTCGESWTDWDGSGADDVDCTCPCPAELENWVTEPEQCALPPARTEAIISEARKRPALDGQPVSEAAADFMRNAKARNARTQAGKDASCRAAAERVFAFIDAANRP